MNSLDKKILQKIDERNQMYNMLVDKRKLYFKIYEEMKALEEGMAKLDNNIWVLSKKPYVKEEI